MSEAEKEDVDDVDVTPDESDGFKVSKKVAVEELLELDAEDESLRKYKEKLLGSAQKQVAKFPDNPALVVVTKFEVVFKDRPSLVFSLMEADITPFLLKEGCEYHFKIEFYVQREIVSGLSYVNVVKKKGIRVYKQQHVLGSYGPQLEPHVYEFPWEEAPSGFLARGKCSARMKFVDDDKNVHSDLSYTFTLKKTWEEE